MKRLDDRFPVIPWVCLAWEAGELSEGQVARALGVDRVTARELRTLSIENGRAIGHVLWAGAREKDKTNQGRRPTL